MLDLIEKKQVYLIVDLSETTFLDDSVLGVLIGTLKRLRELDGTLVLVCSNPKIIRVFEHTGLDKIFDIAKSLDEAIEITKSMKTAPAS
jgi:anti-sigma B factor antagonist